MGRDKDMNDKTMQEIINLMDKHARRLERTTRNAYDLYDVIEKFNDEEEQAGRALLNISCIIERDEYRKQLLRVCLAALDLLLSFEDLKIYVTGVE